MYKIEIELSDEQHQALEDHRKQQKLRVSDPDDPDGVIERPQHKSVAAMVRAAVIQQYAPVVHRNPSPEVQALMREIQAKEKQANELLNAELVVKVSKV